MEYDSFVEESTIEQYVSSLDATQISSLIFPDYCVKIAELNLK